MSTMTEVVSKEPVDTAHVDGAGTRLRGARERKRARGQRAVELRTAGLSYGQIAEALCYADRRGAHNAVTRTLDRTDSALAEDYRGLHLARLERALRAIWPQCLAGDLFAIDRAVRILDREAKLLGLDAPTQVTLTDGTRDALIDTIADLERLLLGSDAVEPPALTTGPNGDSECGEPDEPVG
jgi:hypothetical protein